MKKASVVALQKKGYLAMQLALFAAASMATTYTAASGLDLCLDAYVGVDAQMRHMHFQKNFGGNILQHRYPQANVFAGFKVNEYVGIEAGYEFSKKQHGTKTHPVGDVVFGEPIPPPDPSLVSIAHASRASSKINGFNLNLVGFLPILCEDNTQLIGSVGMASLKSRTRNTFTTTAVTLIPIEVEGETFEIPFTVITPTTHQYKKRKPIFRIAAGVQHLTTCCIGIRGLVTWESTAKLKSTGKDVLTAEKTPGDIAKPKRSFLYGIGIFAPF